MLRILNISIKNFLTIGQVEQSIDLSLNGLILVLGENADIAGANSRNGVGKTAILQAICYALFGKPLTKIRLDNLVNNINAKSMLITLDFEVNGKPYRIERGRKPNVLRFFKQGVAQKEQDEALGENKHTQAEIERIIGMSYILFRHVVALNTSTQPFLREEAAVQRDVIEELFGIGTLSQRADALKRLIDITKDQLRSAEATVKANSEANARIEQAIVRATGEAETWRTAQDRRTQGLAHQVETMHAIDIDAELAIFDQIAEWQERKQEIDGRRRTTEQENASLSSEIERLRESIARYKAEAQTTDHGEIGRLERQAQSYRTEADQDIQSQIDRLRSEVVRRQQDGASRYAEANQLAVELHEIMSRLAKPDEHRCSQCGQGLAGTKHVEKVIDNLKRQEAQLTEKITRLLTEHQACKDEAAVVEAEIDKRQRIHREHCADLRAKAVAIEETIAQITADQAAKRAVIKTQIEQLDDALAECLHRQSDLQKTLTGLPEVGPAPVSRYQNRDAVWLLRRERDQLLSELEAELAKPNPFESKIEALRGTLVTIDYDELNELTSRHKHETFLHKLLTAKDSFVRKKIIDQNLNYLNKRLDHYLQRLGLLHEVEFQADLSVEISLLGADFDFEQLSRGEQNRVIMAMSWSFRDVWENLNSKLNLLFVDEMLDQGTDGAGVEAALDILASMATDRSRSIFLISHREELRDRIDNVLLVRKESQFTSFA